MYEESERRSEPVSLDRLKAILDAEINDGLGYLGSQLSNDRAAALDYYYGRKRGVFQAEEGRSSVVTRDVQETVEWATAQIVRMFTGEEYVVFEPEGPDDVEAARQETDYINYVIQRDNDGFGLFHDWIKDGLLSRTGIVHVQWDDTPDVSLEMYEGLDQQQVELLAMEDGTEIVEMDQREVLVEAVDEQGQVVQQPVPVFDVRVRHERPKGRINVQVIPPEEFVIDRRARSITDAQFVAHRYLVTKGELRQMGLDEETIARISGYEDENEYDDERYARDITRDTYDFEKDGVDEESGRTWAYDCYLKIDWDGDGHDELRRVTYIGREVVSNEPAEEIPYAVFCPVPMPHRFYGQSYADLVMDLQEVRTALLRGSLDNLYLTNMPMREAVEGQVNMKDLLSPRAGGVIRTKAPGMLREVNTTPMMQPSLSMMEFVDTMRESRTGLTRYNQGLDAESLNKTAAGMEMILNQSQLRIELIARLFAENAVKRLFKLVHGLVRRHQDIARTVKLTGQWVTVDPRDWRERTNLTCTVGLGNGTRDQQLASVQALMQQQAMDMQMGLPIIGPQHVYNARRKFASLLGYKDTENYYAPPPTPEQQQQQAMAEQQAQQQAMQQQVEMQAMLEQAKEQAKAQGRIAEAQAKFQQEMAKAESEHRMKLEEIASRERNEGQRLTLDREKAEQDFQIKVAELNQEHQHFVAEQAQERELAKEKMAVDGMKYTREADIERELMQEMRDGGSD